MTNYSLCGVQQDNERDCKILVAPGSPFNICREHYAAIHDHLRFAQNAADPVTRLAAACPECGVRALLASLARKTAKCENCGNVLTADEARRLSEAAAATQKPAAPRPTPVVYYLRVGQLIKIGYTSDLPQRLRAYPPDTLVLATEPGDMSLEQQRHRQFSWHRVAGREWFDPAPPLLRHINSLREQPLTAAELAA